MTSLKRFAVEKVARKKMDQFGLMKEALHVPNKSHPEIYPIENSEGWLSAMT